MTNKHGTLSIDSDNLFPIIKKWLYSDHDIFYRELISNGCDAITKLKKLAVMGEYEEVEGEEYKIDMQFSTEILKPVIEGEETEAEKQAKEEEQKTVGQWWITVLVGFAIISITVAVIVVGKFSRMMRMR